MMNNNLPQNLRGTEKQIAWATEIRAKAIKDAEQYMIEKKANMDAFEVLAEIVVENEINASDWILRRGSGGQHFINLWLKAYTPQLKEKMEAK